ncbi:hypothetical protein [Blastococcus sp. SYSU DS0539]
MRAALRPLTLFSTLALMLLSLLVTAGTSSAAPPGKITICHSTGSAENPYVSITVSEKALAGHVEHGDDIIPAPPTGCPTSTTPPVDLCPNIAGDQATVPPGMAIDPAGNCMPVVVQPCDAETISGGQGVTTTGHELGTSGPTSFLFQFDAISVPDRFQVFYEGALIYDSGFRGDTGYTDPGTGHPITVSGPGAGSATVVVPAGTATSVTVVVTGPIPGTAWTYTVNCPA